MQCRLFIALKMICFQLIIWWLQWYAKKLESLKIIFYICLKSCDWKVIMKILFAFLFMGLMFCMVVSFFGGLAVGIGSLLRTCLPGLSVDALVTIGAITGTASVYFSRILMNAFTKINDDPVGASEDHPVLIFPNDFLFNAPTRSRLKKKKQGQWTRDV